MIAGASLYQLQKVHFDPSIGKGASFTNAKEFFTDVGAAYKLLGSKGLRSLTVSSALLAGAETSFLYSYSNSMANEYIANDLSVEALVPVAALVVLNAPAFITRLNSKPLLKAFGGDNMAGYRNLLTASLVSTGVGSYLLITQDDPVTFAAGLALTSVGFSQITGSILRYGHHKLAFELGVPKHPIITTWDVSYPTIFFGMSLVSTAHSKMSDRNIAGLEVDKEDKRSLKNSSMQEMLIIPMAALLAGAGFSYLGMRPSNSVGLIKGNPFVAPLGMSLQVAGNKDLQNLISLKPNFNTPNYNTPMLYRQSELKYMNFAQPDPETFKFYEMSKTEERDSRETGSKEPILYRGNKSKKEDTSKLDIKSAIVYKRPKPEDINPYTKGKQALLPPDFFKGKSKVGSEKRSNTRR